MTTKINTTWSERLYGHIMWIYTYITSTLNC